MTCCSSPAGAVGLLGAVPVRAGTGGTLFISWPPGLRGGKAIPNSVESHTKVIVTFTAPSFRAVHVRRVKGRKTLPCPPRDKARGSASSADRVNGWAVARVRNRIAVLPCRVDPGLLGA